MAASDPPGGIILNNNADFSSVPTHIVSDASQLPAEFLDPSAEKQLVIGFDCEGIDLCRQGALCVMQLAFPDAIYLVDAVEGGEAIVRACKPALESSYITKVIHDCKRDSEALYFQFGIKLHNVVDTQIAYSLIEEQEGRKRAPDDYISFVGLLADPRYCGLSYLEKEEVRVLLRQDPKFCGDGGKRGRGPLALIIDGPSLVHILQTELEEQLFEVAIVCHAVLCCRVAPLQKAGIVSLIKMRTNDLTLSIGDGANDVSMIQMADVGIGISGQEGRQAIMASDFAMGQFRFLVPLLLVHGHWNYYRMSYMVLYNIYRNAVLIFVNYWYLFYTEFSLAAALTELDSLLYGTLYTSLQNIYAGIYDEDLSRETLLKYPEMYEIGLREERYSLKLFVLTMTDCLWQSLALFYVSFFAYEHSSLDFSGLGGIWLFGTVLLVNLHLAMDIIRWNLKLHAVIWGSTIVTFVFSLALFQSPALPDYRSFSHLVSADVFWLMLLCMVVIALLPRFVCKVFCEYLWPDDIRIGREMEMLEKTAVATENGTY